MPFIKLTTKTSDSKIRKVYVNINHVRTIYYDNDKINIEYSNGSIAVFVDSETYMLTILELLKTNQ